MGDPRKRRASYQTPSHPWSKSRIDEEKVLIKEYGLKNKKEIWKMNSIAVGLAQQAKKLIALRTDQAEKERKQLMQRIQRYGLLPHDAVLKDVLDINTRSILERRLQTILFRKNLARSIKQARQFIVHEHVSIGDKKITVPSYLVPLNEDEQVSFSEKSNLSDEEHPERKIEEVVAETPEVKETEEEVKKETKKKVEKVKEEKPKKKVKEETSEDKEVKKDDN